MSTPPSSIDSICANCGKGEESSVDLKSCTACKLVKYCNRDCQIAHRPQHKKVCRKRATEIYDEQLFKEPPPRKECPICMLPLPLFTITNNNDNRHSGVTFHSCCGNRICDGCSYTMAETCVNRSGGKNRCKNMMICAFCRTPKEESDEDELQRVNKLIGNGNAYAYNMLAGYYERGLYGLPQDTAKANELLLKAGELGCALAYYNLGNSYYHGSGVEIDKKKAKHYYELAAMSGDIKARHNLGIIEGRAGNYQRAMKHYIISASAGFKESLNTVKEGFMTRYVTKEQYANTLREYQKSQDETKSDTRDKALAARNQRMNGYLL